ncbi:hypothetical protein TELCIR_13205 [Teladorsagia circumcincta]|uniref:Uncharacterized protein n=1 Tax=Teladorsagia circumcincta TaxID=45464 RepID=A0A2G9U4G1_TELCI|nr:hypothetical protein TELCIR_13205 [Teladorsagia circumcincta]
MLEYAQRNPLRLIGVHGIEFDWQKGQITVGRVYNAVFFSIVVFHRRYLPKGRNLAAPSASEFARWQNYERGEAGTGLTPDSGPGWGPGLGDVNIATGLGVETPVGGLGIRRDFDLAFGGSGRSGGRSFGYGNGHQRQIGSAPWAWP